MRLQKQTRLKYMNMIRAAKKHARAPDDPELMRVSKALARDSYLSIRLLMMRVADIGAGDELTTSDLIGAYTDNQLRLLSEWLSLAEKKIDSLKQIINAEILRRTINENQE